MGDLSKYYILMNVVPRDSTLWEYMPDEIRDLVEDGETILNFVHDYHEQADISDYSFMVFPFAKAYEGFLKRFLLDIGMIREEEYFSDEIRIGRILNPNFKGKNAIYEKLSRYKGEGKNVSKKLWKTWKQGRNLVFHYFPHNYRKLSYNQSLDIVNMIVDAMANAVVHIKIEK